MDRTVLYLSLFLFVISSLIVKFLDFQINLKTICHHDAKPIIYGEELCKEIYHNKISLTNNIFQKLMYLLSQKTVLQATFGNQDILLKSLVPRDHFEVIENRFHDTFSNILAKGSINIAKYYIYTSMRINPGSAIISKIRLCPYSSNIDNLFKKINSSDLLFQDYLYIWTIVECNPEPLILKMLQPPKWPVPQFYGSCGRLIAVEDCGTILTEFYSSDWATRANLSYQLLDNALKFTFDDPDFAFYFTDMSPDNIAVNDLGYLKFIDLEYVIIVDKNPIIQENMEDWKHNHTSRHINCRNCFIFESDEICIYHASDHNIYAVCKEIFADSSLFPGGFLHSPPSFEGPELQQLNLLINECIEAHISLRFETAYKIMSLLKLFL